MNNPFELDPYPGNPKILFIGLGVSTHTHSWVDLLSNAKMNVRLFSVPDGGIPPPDWKTRTYVCSPSFQLPENLDPITRQSLYPLPQEIKLFETEFEKRNIALERSVFFKFSVFAKGIINFSGKRLGMPPLYHDYSRYHDLRMPNFKIPDVSSPEEWLAKIIRDWRPDIVHTLGLFDGQGGSFYYEVRERFGLKGRGKWILQLRGGSDLALRQHNPETARQILKIFNECDEIITDNYININYIKQLGLAHKIASIAPVPGTGGLDTDVDLNDILLPSKKERIILWPKTYESLWSKALPVMEAIKMAWEDIKPCKIYMTASTPETETWFLAILPQEVKENCILVRRVPRNELLDLMKKARVLLIPSLVDGVPNSLYEAMVNGVFPIVSPLDSITPIVKNVSNVLFARNLYPTEISEALIKAMSDDLLVDDAARNNLNLVKQIASRKKIAKQVIEYYQHFSSQSKAMNANLPLVTVITPTYNRADYLPETIESVLSQDYPNIEYIVLDDGSKDNTKEVMEKYRERVIFESHSNMGETRTVNKGFEMANGECICVVNSDDPLLPGAITKMVSALGSDPDALAVYPDWVEIDADSMPIKEMRLPDYDIFNMLNDFNVAMGPGNVFKRSALEKYGFRDTNRRYTGDLEFWFRLASHGKLLHTPEILATHRTHPHSASVSEKSSKLSEELLSIVESLLSSGVLPKKIQDKQSQILSRAYYVSIFYCPHEPAKRLKYFLLAFFYDPIHIFIHVLLAILHRIYRFLIRCIAAFLRLVLPEKTYNALRAWRHDLRKTNP